MPARNMITRSFDPSHGTKDVLEHRQALHLFILNPWVSVLSNHLPLGLHPAPLWTFTPTLYNDESQWVAGRELI